ncbi:MAG: PilZ domain-containing protein [Myxococcales bacterium]|nr:PilZ domain-containing protein [Myxococcales bacterium]
MTRREDRRSTPRIPYEGRALVHLGNHHLQCEMVDLGADGVFVLSPVHARAGLKVTVELALPRLGRVRLAGAIAREGQHAGRYGWGIAFADTPPATRALMRDFVLFELRMNREARGAAERSQKLRESLSEEVLGDVGDPRSDDGVYMHVRPARRKAGSDPHVERLVVGDSVGVNGGGRSPSALAHKSQGKQRPQPSKRAQGQQPPARMAASARRAPTAEVQRPSGTTREDNAVYQRAQARARARAVSAPDYHAAGSRTSSAGRSASSARVEAARERGDRHAGDRDAGDRRQGEPSAAVREAQAFLDELERSGE